MVDKLIDQSIYWRNYTDKKGNNFQGYVFIKIINDEMLIYRKLKYKRGKYWLEKRNNSRIETFKLHLEYRVTDKNLLNELWDSIRSERKDTK
jgi:hypothetical protein